MTQLLISVKSLDECLLARYANVDVIDLKDPSVGALGALNVEIVRQILVELDGSAFVSATIGEGHLSVDAVVNDIEIYAGLGVDVVKLGVSALFFQESFFTEMRKLTTRGFKLVAVFFADKPLDYGLIAKLRQCGFYGVMLDTQDKQFSLPEVQTAEALKKFTATSKECGLISGLAGSLNKMHLSGLLKLKPDFVGMRGGVCEKHDRASSLSCDKVVEVKELLLNYNGDKGFRASLQAVDLLI